MTTLSTMAPELRLRWSQTVRCARQAVYSATGAAERELSERERRILFRGQRLDRDVADWFAAEHGEDDVERQVKIVWAGGVGHADIYLRSSRMLIEVLSSARASRSMREVKLLQLAGYMAGHEESKLGCLLVVDPADFEFDETFVAKESVAYQELLGRVRERLDTIRRWQQSGTLPERECRRPSEAIGRFCRHADHCFEGWEPPPPLTETDDPAAVDLAERWLSVKLRERDMRSRLELLERERKEIEQELSAWVESAGEHRVGWLRVRRVDVRRSPTLDLRKALLAGALEEESVAAFMRPGAAYSTWDVEPDASPQRELPREDDEEVPF